MIMTTLKILIIVIILMTNTIVSKSNHAPASEVGSSAHMIGAGRIEGFSTSAGDFIFNPASLAYTVANQVSYFGTTVANEYKYNHLAYSRHTPFGNMGISYFGLNTDGLYKTKNVNGTLVSEGQFGYSNTVLTFGYSYQIQKDLLVGSSLSLYQASFSSTKYKGSGTGINIGALYLYEKAVISASIQNFIASEFNQKNSANERLAKESTVSCKYPVGDGQLYSQIKLIENLAGILPSFAYELPLAGQQLSLTIGYQSYFVLDNIESGMSFGVNLFLKDIDFYYAFETSDVIGASHSHYLSINYKF